MPEVIVSLSLREGRIIGLRRQLDFIGELAELSFDTIESVKTQIRAYAPGPVRAIVRAAAGSASVSRRPLIDISEEIIMAADLVVDQRAHPTTPGADLGWLGQQRTRLTVTGADEALLRVSNGHACSGLGSHLITFADDVAIVSSHPRTPPSVFVELVLEELQAEGIEIRRREEGLSQSLLRANETWSLSPISGVRRVRAWNEYGTLMTAASLPAQSIVPSAREIDARLWLKAERV